MSFATAMGRGIDRIYARLGEPATYRFADSTTTGCTVLPERDLETSGEFSQVNAALVLISVRKSEISSRPLRGERITLTETGKEYVVREVIESDQFEYRFYAA